LGKKLDFKLK